MPSCALQNDQAFLLIWLQTCSEDCFVMSSVIAKMRSVISSVRLRRPIYHYDLSHYYYSCLLEQNRRIVHMLMDVVRYSDECRQNQQHAGEL